MGCSSSQNSDTVVTNANPVANSTSVIKSVDDDVKIIAETNNRFQKRILITNFIKKWTQKDKVIDITI